MSIIRTFNETSRPAQSKRKTSTIPHDSININTNDSNTFVTNIPHLTTKQFSIICEIIELAQQKNNFIKNEKISFLSILDAYDEIIKTNNYLLSTSEDTKIYTALIAFNQNKLNWWNSLLITFQSQILLNNNNNVNNENENDANKVYQRIQSNSINKQSNKLNNNNYNHNNNNELIIDDEKLANDNNIINNNSNLSELSIVRHQWFQSSKTPKIVFDSFRQSNNNNHNQQQYEFYNEENSSQLLSFYFHTWSNYTKNNRTPDELTRLSIIYFLDRHWAKWRELSLKKRADRWNNLYRQKINLSFIRYWRIINEKNRSNRSIIQSHNHQLQCKQKFDAWKKWRQSLLNNREMKILRQRAEHFHRVKQIKLAVENWKSFHDQKSQYFHLINNLQQIHHKRVKYRVWHHWYKNYQLFHSHQLSVNSSVALKKTRLFFYHWRTFAKQISYFRHQTSPIILYVIYKWHLLSFGSNVLLSSQSSPQSSLSLNSDQLIRMNQWKLKTIFNTWKIQTKHFNQSRHQLLQFRHHHYIQQWKMKGIKSK